MWRTLNLGTRDKTALSNAQRESLWTAACQADTAVIRVGATIGHRLFRGDESTSVAVGTRDGCTATEGPLWRDGNRSPLMHERMGSGFVRWFNGLRGAFAALQWTDRRGVLRPVPAGPMAWRMGNSKGCGPYWKECGKTRFRGGGAEIAAWERDGRGGPAARSADETGPGARSTEVWSGSVCGLVAGSGAGPAGAGRSPEGRHGPGPTSL